MEIGAINSRIAAAVGALTERPGAAKAGGGGADFVASLDSALQAVSRSQQGAAELQRRFQLESPEVGLEETMIAMNKASLSFQAAVQVRNRLVQAYEQVMNMPV